MNILGCSTGQRKIDPTRAMAAKAPCPEVDVELWRIDPQALELYRLVDDENEEFLKIQNSKLMHQFIVIDIEEYGKLIEAFFKECRKGDL